MLGETERDFACVLLEALSSTLIPYHPCCDQGCGGKKTIVTIDAEYRLRLFLKQMMKT